MSEPEDTELSKASAVVRKLETAVGEALGAPDTREILNRSQQKLKFEEGQVVDINRELEAIISQQDRASAMQQDIAAAQAILSKNRTDLETARDAYLESIHHMRRQGVTL